MSKPPIGFIGLGVMGLPMALNLSRAGYFLTVFDKDPAAAQRAAAEIPGARLAGSPVEVARASTIVVTMLPSGTYVQEVALGERGLIHGFAEGALLLDTSSCEPWLTLETAKALAASGVAMVDAPVSGAQVGAQTGELLVAERLRQINIADFGADMGRRGSDCNLIRTHDGLSIHDRASKAGAAPPPKD